MIIIIIIFFFFFFLAAFSCKAVLEIHTKTQALWAHVGDDRELIMVCPALIMAKYSYDLRVLREAACLHKSWWCDEKLKDFRHGQGLQSTKRPTAEKEICGVIIIRRQTAANGTGQKKKGRKTKR